MKKTMIRLRMSDLPKPVEIEGACGEREHYMLTPAGRKKCGAALQKVLVPAEQSAGRRIEKD